VPEAPSMVTDLRAGQILDGRFEIAELIGRGSMGPFFKATDLTTRCPVAVKMLLAVESDPAFLSRFQREIEMVKRLDHPGILKILAVDNATRPYVVTEYLEGETLRDLLQRVHPLPLGEALRIAMLICDALKYMHSHDVVHRGLKPTNVMLCCDGSVRIIGFGTAMAGAVGCRTFAGFFGRLGTPHYMAPEQVRGQRGEARADVYSLGALLYEMTTGHAPYDEQQDFCSIMNARLVGDPVAPRIHNPNVTPHLEEIILHALARDDDRYQSAAAVRCELAAPELVPVTGRADRLKAPSSLTLSGV
jgi:serine/threonine protein kinase